MPPAAGNRLAAWPPSEPTLAALAAAIGGRAVTLLVEPEEVDGTTLARRLERHCGTAVAVCHDRANLDFIHIEMLVTVTWRMPAAPVPVLALWPPVLVAGIGCTGGVPAETLAASATAMLRQAGLAPEAVGLVATSARRAEEPALHAWAEALGAGFVACDDATLAAQAVPTPSAQLQARLGVASVAEAAALAAAGATSLLLTRRKAALPGGHHHTLAVARRSLDRLAA
ncbi:Cobalamin biosynthesis protein [Rhodovastum atsumiense]|uniref:Cobalamin biosynthesis protein n=1 Tax=Rhodovastum atsumiense TaxID=504468 RepID=A0A5M6IX48_9PROT|nr:cobalamin biosynthesis protein [Rhodovastum atsumiense]KAA5612821.1 cobalamin biosynthesis protein [Rhodovastum atsumiense]CAH2601114.1 Cobalamin biosynthesis protein [Rhodovastum atsumiense]